MSGPKALSIVGSHQFSSSLLSSSLSSSNNLDPQEALEALGRISSRITANRSSSQQSVTMSATATATATTTDPKNRASPGSGQHSNSNSSASSSSSSNCSASSSVSTHSSTLNDKETILMTSENTDGGPTSSTAPTAASTSELKLRALKRHQTTVIRF